MEIFHVTHVDLYPFLFGQSLVLLHEHGLRHVGLVGGGCNEMKGGVNAGIRSWAVWLT